MAVEKSSSDSFPIILFLHKIIPSLGKNYFYVKFNLTFQNVFSEKVIPILFLSLYKFRMNENIHAIMILLFLTLLFLLIQIIAG